MTPKGQVTKEKNRYMGLHQNLKLLCNGHHQNSEKTAHKMRETFANHIPDKRFVSRTYKELS